MGIKTRLQLEQNYHESQHKNFSFEQPIHLGATVIANSWKVVEFSVQLSGPLCLLTTIQRDFLSRNGGKNCTFVSNGQSHTF